MNFKLKFRHCQQSYQFCLNLSIFSLLCFFALSVQAQSRKPANFMPDDDLIMVPIQYESPFLARVIDVNNPQMQELKLQLDHWTNQQIYVEDWGLESSNTTTIPTSEEKFRYFQRTFFRYAGRQARDPVRQEVRSWWYEWTAEQEVQAIINSDQEINAENATDLGKKISKQKVIKENDKFQFRFKPQPLKGFASLSMTSGYVNANAIMGINGRVEVKVDRHFHNLGIYAMANINVSDDVRIAYIQKQLTEKLSLGLSHTKSDSILSTFEDNRLTFQYYTAF